MSDEVGSEMVEEFDLVPSPRVLPMLGEINLEQWRCIGELVDNSIDGFLHASRRGQPVASPNVQVWLPAADRDDAIIQIIDNGPGMAAAELAKAVKAGWSGNNPIDNLGLFGMGFNIATARLGQVTEVWTTREGDAEWHGLEIDFDRLQRQGNFRTGHLTEPKPEVSTHGTRIVIKRLKPAQRQWLARGANQTQVRTRLGQVYSSMLVPGGKPIEFKLYIGTQQIRSRRFCLWDETRSAELPDLGEVTAIQAFNFILGERHYCSACMNWFPAPEGSVSQCPICEASGTVQKRARRIHGWIGLQRYADTMHFGFDFVRNGRKIELESKDLFVWKGVHGDEPEYPIDDPSRRGRFVGEIHIDHCRVNFAKERFDRSDPAWEEMLRLIRGDGPLRPERARELGCGPNTSPLFKLYKAFRRLRPHSSVAGGWRRLLSVPDNKNATELAQKFYEGHPDYQDDSKWWHLVEEAERKALTEDEDESAEEGEDEDDLLGPDDGGEDSEGDQEGEPAPDYRAMRRETPSLSRTYVYSPAGQSFIVAGYECSPHDPDLPIDTPWRLLMADVATRTYHFLYRPKAPAFHSITLTPLDALLMELALLTVEYLKSSPTAAPFAAVLSHFRQEYGQGSTLDARAIAAEAAGALSTLAQGLLQATAEGERGGLFDALTADQQADVMRRLAQEGVAPAAHIADGTFITLASHGVIARIVEQFPALCFDGAFWDWPFASLDYGDPALTERARQRVIDRAKSIISDAGWLAEADPSSLLSAQRDELVRGLMSVSMLRPSREIS
jgi:hypothetical protein